jgi:hypothetical protein
MRVKSHNKVINLPLGAQRKAANYGGVIQHSAYRNLTKEW